MRDSTTAPARPRVGYILKKFPRLSETFVLNEILELERQGLDVHVISLYVPDEGRFHSLVAHLRNPIVYVPEMSFRECFAYLMRRRRALQPMLTNLGSALDYVLGLGEEHGAPVMKRALAAALEVERLGLTHLHAHFATIAARTALAIHLLLGTRFSITAHAKDIYREGVSAREFSTFVDRSSFLVTVCDANRDYILETLAKASEVPSRAEKVIRIYNGVDLSLFEPATVPTREPRLLAVGRLVRKKGFHVLIDACAKLVEKGVEFKCDIIGDGEERERLSAQIAERALTGRVRLLGAMPQDQVVPEYRRSILSLLPCVTDRDGNRDALPTSLLESFASGVPVISSPVGGVSEIVDHGVNGWLVPEDDASALADAIARSIADPRELDRMGVAARRKAESMFDLRSNVARLRELLVASAQRVDAEFTAAGACP